MIRLAYGLPGAGKSTLLHDMVRQDAEFQRFYIIDHEAGWGEDGFHWRGKPPPNLRLFIGQGDFDAFAEEEHPETGVFVFRNVEADAVARLTVQKGHAVFVDDEIDLIARRKGWELSPLRAIVHTGRHAENEKGEFTQVHLLGACRRPQNLHTDLTELADDFFVFRLKGKNTKQRLIDDNILESDEEWERLRELPKFHFKWVSGEGESWLDIPPLQSKTGEKDKVPPTIQPGDSPTD